MNHPEYDAIIVGAGHNGLTTAAYLARAGLKVLVLEQRNVLGGCAATEEVYPGYKFDTGSHDAGLFRNDIADELNLDSYGLKFLDSEAVVTSLQPDARPLTLWRDVGTSVDEIARFSEADAARFPDFVHHLGRHAATLDEILSQPAPEANRTSARDLLPLLRAGMKLRRKGGSQLMEFLRVIPLTIKEYLDEWFESEVLKGALAGPALGGGMPGVQSGGTMLMFLYQQGGSVNGGCRPRRSVQGGMGQLSLALANVARDFGVEIQTGMPVAKILLDNDEVMVTGVQLSDDVTISAKTIVSNADPRLTFFHLVGGRHLEPRFMREISNIRFQGTVAKVNLALDRLPEFRGVDDDTQLSGHIVLSPDLDYLERAWDDAKYGRMSRAPYIDAVIPSLLDPTVTPPGNHVMSITVQYAPFN
jgi:phytoene dehydrogenase-like protein